MAKPAMLAPSESHPSVRLRTKLRHADSQPQAHLQVVRALPLGDADLTAEIVEELNLAREIDIACLRLGHLDAFRR